MWTGVGPAIVGELAGPKRRLRPPGAATATTSSRSRIFEPDELVFDEATPRLALGRDGGDQLVDVGTAQSCCQVMAGANLISGKDRAIQAGLRTVLSPPRNVHQGCTPVRLSVPEGWPQAKNEPKSPGAWNSV